MIRRARILIIIIPMEVDNYDESSGEYLIIIVTKVWAIIVIIPRHKMI